MSLFHDGERAMQRRAGEEFAAQCNSRIIATRIPEAAGEFVEAQPMCLITSVGRDGSVWISPVMGEPGLVRILGPGHIAIDWCQALRQQGDPLWSNLEPQAMVGLLLIELETRRRFRINGRIESGDEERLVIAVTQAYPNCTKYIQRRFVSRAAAGRSTTESAAEGVYLEPAQQTLIRRADTVFVGSLHPEAGADASHRGGQPGFVQVLGSRTLRIADFPGNGMFNTLGNFSAYPRAGLLVFDFDQQTMFQMTGAAEVHWKPEGGVPGSLDTGRFWDLHMQRWRQQPLPVAWEWGLAS